MSFDVQTESINSQVVGTFEPTTMCMGCDTAFCKRQLKSQGHRWSLVKPPWLLTAFTSSHWSFRTTCSVNSNAISVPQYMVTSKKTRLFAAPHLHHDSWVLTWITLFLTSHCSHVQTWSKFTAPNVTYDTLKTCKISAPSHACSIYCRKLCNNHLYVKIASYGMSTCLAPPARAGGISKTSEWTSLNALWRRQP